MFFCESGACLSLKPFASFHYGVFMLSLCCQNLSSASCKIPTCALETISKTYIPTFKGFTFTFQGYIFTF